MLPATGLCTSWTGVTDRLSAIEKYKDEEDDSDEEYDDNNGDDDDGGDYDNDADLGTVRGEDRGRGKILLSSPPRWPSG